MPSILVLADDRLGEVEVSETNFEACHSESIDVNFERRTLDLSKHFLNTFHESDSISRNTPSSDSLDSSLSNARTRKQSESSIDWDQDADLPLGPENMNTNSSDVNIMVLSERETRGVDIPFTTATCLADDRFPKRRRCPDEPRELTVCRTTQQSGSCVSSDVCDTHSYEKDSEKQNQDVQERSCILSCRVNKQGIPRTRLTRFGLLWLTPVAPQPRSFTFWQILLHLY